METRAVNPQVLLTNAAPFLSKLLGTYFVARTSFLGDSNFSSQTNRGVPHLPVLFEVMSDGPQKYKLDKTDGQGENSDVITYLLKNLNKGDMKFALLFKLKKEDMKQVERGDITVLKSCLKNVSEGAILSGDKYQVIPRNQLYAIVEKIQQTLKTESTPENVENLKHCNFAAQFEKCSGDTAYPINFLSTSKPTFCNKSTQYEMKESCPSSKVTGTYFSKCIGIENRLDAGDGAFKHEPDTSAKSLKVPSSKVIKKGECDKNHINGVCRTNVITPPIAHASVIIPKQLTRHKDTTWQSVKLETGSDNLEEVKTGENQGNEDKFLSTDEPGHVDFDKYNRVISHKGKLNDKRLVDQGENKQREWLECSALRCLEEEFKSSEYGYNSSDHNPDSRDSIGNDIESDFLILNTSMRTHKPSKIPMPIEQCIRFQRLSGKYHAQNIVTSPKEQPDITSGKIESKDMRCGFGTIRKFNANRRETSKVSSEFSEQDNQKLAKRKTKLPVSKKNSRFAIMKSLEKRQTETESPKNNAEANINDKAASSERFNIMPNTKSFLISGKIKENEIYDQKQRELVKLIANGVEQEIYSNLKRENI